MARNIHPGLPGAIVRSSAEVINDSGELRHSINWTLAPETIREFREGYRCALPPHGCGAAQTHAFPEKCIEPYCNFNLKRDLARWLENAYAGDEDLWPGQDEAEAQRAYEREQDEFYAGRAGIVLPPGFRR
jgi:hypothetical protein